MLTVLGDARWWAGIPLVDRCRPGTSAPPRPTDAQRRRAELRLRLWRDGRSVPGVPVSLTRPRTEGSLGEEHLVALLAEPVESLRRRLPQAPAWLHVIEEAWSQTSTSDAGEATGCLCGGRSDPGEPRSADEAYLNWVRPLTRWAAERLRAALAGSATGAAELPPDHSLLLPDQARLLAMVKRVLVLELQVARRHGRLCGSDPRQRFGCFALGIAQPVTGLDLLAGYPVLARDLVAHVRDWIDARVEFAERFVRDLPELRRRFGVTGGGVAAITAMRFDAGDPHRGGRSVAVVDVGAGRIVYKPRPLTVDRGYAELVRWVNSRGPRHKLRAVETWDRGTHGWARFVQARPCADDAELARFYWRQGAHLALLHLLRAYDMHMHNVVAAGGHPLLIDLEALFHAPAAFEDIDDEHGTAVGRALRESVLAVLLLPQRQVLVDPEGAHGLDISGIGGGRCPERLGMRRGLTYADDGTDQARAVRRRLPRPAAGNLPSVAGRRQTPPVRGDEVLAGFESCYRLLMANRSALLAPDGPLAAFAGTPVRAVLRSTSTYAGLLTESWHPDLLRDAADREHLLAVLATRGGLAAHPGVVNSERRQLAQRDVPVFSLITDDTTLYDPTGPVAADFVPVSGLDLVRQRADRLSERDLAAQRWFLLASLATLDAEHRPTPAALPVTGSRADLNREVTLAAARALADRLVDTAFRDDPSIGPEWLSLNLVGGHWTVGRTDLGMSAGVTGIALFLAELDHLVGEARYRDVVEELAGGLFTVDEPPGVDELAGLSVGLFEDLGSLVFLAARLRELWGDGVWLTALDWLVPALAHHLGDESIGDVVSGVPGAALALLRVRRVSGGDTVEAALRTAGQRLLATPAGPPRPGFGHGWSGHAYALVAVGAATGDGRLTDAAWRLAAAERHLISGDLPGGWCDGLTGIALSRGGMLTVGVTGAVGGKLGDDLRRATEGVRDLLAGAGRGRVTDDSLCHGVLGMAEALTVAAAHLDDDRLPLLAARAVVGVAERVLADSTVTGVPTGVWTPGLLTGAAGIGHGLLRAVEPETVVSVLAPS